MYLDLVAYNNVLRAFRKHGANFTRVAEASGVGRRSVAALFTEGLRPNRRCAETRGPIRDVLFAEPPVATASIAVPGEADVDVSEISDVVLIARGRRAASDVIGSAAKLVTMLTSSKDGIAAALAASPPTPERASKVLKNASEALAAAVGAVERLVHLDRLVAGQPSSIIEQRAFTAAIPVEEMKMRTRAVLEAVEAHARTLPSSPTAATPEPTNA